MAQTDEVKHVRGHIYELVEFLHEHGVLDGRVLSEWMLADSLPARLQLQLHKYIWPPETRGV